MTKETTTLPNHNNIEQENLYPVNTFSHVCPDLPGNRTAKCKCYSRMVNCTNANNHDVGCMPNTISFAASTEYDTNIQMSHINDNAKNDIRYWKIIPMLAKNINH